MCLKMLTGKYELANLRKRLLPFCVARVIRAAAPNGILVKLNSLGCSPAKDHRTQPPISQRKRLNPLPGRLPIPEHRTAGCVFSSVRGGRTGLGAGLMVARKRERRNAGCDGSQKVTSLHVGLSILKKQLEI